MSFEQQQRGDQNQPEGHEEIEATLAEVNVNLATLETGFFSETEIENISIGAIPETEEELMIAEVEFNTLPANVRERNDALLSGEFQEIFPAPGEEESDAVAQVLEEEGRGVDEEGESIIADTPPEQKEFVAERIKKIKHAKFVATGFAFLGGMAAVSDAEARDVNLGRAFEQVIVNPMFEAKRAEQRAETQYKTQLRTIQLRYNTQANRINHQLSQLTDPTYLALKKRQSDLGVESRYASRIANADTPEERTTLVAEKDAQKEAAWLKQQSADQRAQTTLQLKLTEMDSKFESEVQNAKAKFADALQRIGDVKSQRRAEQIMRTIQQAIR
jgi:hypothetical protein